MAKSKTASSGQTLEQLQERFSALAEQKIVVETDRKHALERLESLKTKAREEYGTDDLEQLQQKLEQMKADNEKKRSTYQKQLDTIEKQLREVHAQFSEDEVDA